MTLADLSHLAAVPRQAGADPNLFRDELLHIIGGAIANDPRSLQKRIGPSGLGHPCDRWMSYTLMQKPAVNTSAPNWKATIGKAVHAWLEETFAAANTGLEHVRWLVEHKVSVGDIIGEDIDGSTDLYDVVTATVVDWKITTVNKIKAYKRNGPGQQYLVQGMSYGRGWTRRGLPVERVAVFFLPRDGELSQAYFWNDTYDEQIALDALARANRIATVNAGVGPQAPAYMTTADHYCTSCPFFLPNSTDLAQGCPGDTSRAVREDPITALIA